MTVDDSAEYRILVVDDNDSICKLLTFLLKQEGFQVQTALDGETAYQLLSTQSFHILIVDFFLPDMHGDAIIEVARQRLPAIKTVMISSHPNIMERAKACQVDLAYIKGDSLMPLCDQVVSLAASIR